MVDRTIQVVRDVATALRPAVLDFGILAAVRVWSRIPEAQRHSLHGQVPGHRDSVCGG